MSTPLYVSTDEVNQRRAGDIPNVSDAWNQTLEAKIEEKSRDLDRMVAKVRGVSGEFRIVADAVASSRTFTSRGGTVAFLPIDDCIAITSASLRARPGATAQALVEGTDYVAVHRGGVIVALRPVTAPWPDFPASLDVVARWGLMAAPSADLREVVIVEVIRSYLGDRAGNDDRLGMTPFGSVMTAKAYTALVNRLVNDLAYGGGGLR